MQIEGLTVIVSGAASGIGRRFTEALLASGAQHVVGIDSNTESLRALSSTLGDARLIPLEVDVSQERSIAAAMRQLHERDIVADVLVNNAGVLRDGRLATLDDSGYARKLPSAQWQSVLNTNLTGPFLLAREFVAARLESARQGGVIVNVSSVSSAGNPGQSNYAAAKAGLDALTRTWSLELAEYGIRVAGIAPGLTDTPMAATLNAAEAQRLIAGMPLGRMITTQEIWLGLRFALECDAFNGRTLFIDGGGDGL